MNLKTEKFEFLKYDDSTFSNLLKRRKGEVKLGEKFTDISSAKYVILGIEESIGPRANFGKKGAENSLESFLSYFVNMQSNFSLTGDTIHVLGSIRIKKESQNEAIELREEVAELDEFILKILHANVKKGQLPIVIGGGHNNAFPLICFSAQQQEKKIDVINLDAHADYRLLEGRHSGNSFSYAFKEGLLEKYYVLGLHQRYNSQKMLDDLKRDQQYFTFHEDYVMEVRSYREDFNELVETFNKNKRVVGIELDLDTIEYMPSSAFSPVGISIDLARKYIRTMAKINAISYLHLPEGAPVTEIEKNTVGKTLAYLVADFITVNK